MKRYNPKEIEPHWQKIWADSGIYKSVENSSKPKKYVLEYFPYPSGAAMHVGHVRNYTIGDAISRSARMRGYNVLHPMGWDAFGLPAENYAIKTGISPREAVDKNTQKFKKQLIQMGYDYDWSREIDSTDPAYYKWTQWFFLLLFKKKLAYRQESLQWWCPLDKTVLANEQVENGKCWRCGSIVEKKALKQWFFKITDYADRLEKDLDDVNWSESIKTMQRNWIGRSSGAEIEFKVDKTKEKIKIFTTRPDTIYGATFIVLAPEHPLVQHLIMPANRQHAETYVAEVSTKSEIDRMDTEREKTGVFTGSYAINPANGKKIPIWIADFVLAGYGTGAVFADACDERDFEFAKKFDIPLIPTVVPDNPKEAKKVMDLEYAYTLEGKLVNSGPYSGLTTQEAREKIVADLLTKKVAKEKVNYKIRDWLISRQRYWGAPIPIIHCPKDGPQPVPEADLPVVLPKLNSYEPTGDGRSPLARVESFVKTKCPKCGGPAERETDTMDGFACSSWYFLRFTDPNNSKKPFDKSKAKFWLPVNDYIGGAEHAVMHLLYARFWTKVMFDDGLIDFSEPFTTLRNQGMILAPDGQKMSKSKNNTIEPEVLIDQGYGADSVRVLELFLGPWNQTVNWSTEAIGGSFRFLQRIWVLVQEFNQSTTTKTKGSDLKLLKACHRTIKTVSEDIDQLRFNTAIATLMEYVNNLYLLKAEDKYADGYNWKFALKALVQLLAPFAPHISEELWHQLDEPGSVHTSTWPVHEQKYLISKTMVIVVQVNGKLRAQLELGVDNSEEEIINAVLADNKVGSAIAGKNVIKKIYVSGRLVNLVVK